MLATAIDDGEEAVAEDFESFGEMVEEWSEAEEPEEADDALDPDAIKAELDEVKAYGALTASIVVNAKGEALLQALRHGFAKLAELGAARKFECHR